MRARSLCTPLHCAYATGLPSSAIPLPHRTRQPNERGGGNRGFVPSATLLVFRQPLYSVSGNPLRVNQMTQQRREHTLGRDTAPSAATDRSSPRARRTRRTPQLLPFECASSPPPSPSSCVCGTTCTRMPSEPPSGASLPAAAPSAPYGKEVARRREGQRRRRQGHAPACQKRQRPALAWPPSARATWRGAYRCGQAQHCPRGRRRRRDGARHRCLRRRLRAQSG